MATFAALGILFIIACLTIGPILTIMALNCLFGLEIPISFATWMAVFWLQLILVARNSPSSK